MPERVLLKPRYKEEVIHKSKQCEYCGHYYIKPCNEETQKECQNIKLETNLK